MPRCWVPFEKAIETVAILFLVCDGIYKKYVILLTIYQKHVMYVENMLTSLRKSLKKWTLFWTVIWKVFG